MKKDGRYTITKLRVVGTPHGDAEVTLDQIDRKDALLRCSCGATRKVRIPNGRIDLPAFARMEAAVKLLHKGDA